MDSQQIRQCSNCTKPFPSDRIDLHQAYCIRNIKKCNQCGAFIDLHDIESHQEQFHQKKPCTYCKQQFLPDDLTAHAGVCDRRPKMCNYCQTNVAAIDYNTHAAVCGARTRVCVICQQPIMLKDYDTHQVRCRQQPPPVVQPVSRPAVSNNVPPLNPGSQLPPDRRHYPHERQRDISGNNVRHVHHNGIGERSLSTKQGGDRHVTRKTRETKYNQIIPQQKSKPMVDILPISVQIALNQAKRENREPFRTKNIQV